MLKTCRNSLIFQTLLLVLLCAAQRANAASVSGAAYVSPNTIRITYTERMGTGAHGGGVLDAANYSIGGPGAGDRVTPDDVTYQSGQTYLLQWTSGKFVGNEILTITVSEDVLDADSQVLETPRTADVYVPFGDWKWMSGSSTGNYNVDFPATHGGTGHPGECDGAVSWTDLDGNLWLFGGRGKDANSYRGFLNDLWKFDIDGGTDGRGEWTWVAGSKERGQPGTYPGAYGGTGYPGARQYAVSWTDSDGNLWMFGGWGYADSGDFNLLNDLWKFDIDGGTGGTGEWTWVAGSSQTGQLGNYSAGRGNVGGYPGARRGAVSWIDSDDNLWLFGGSHFNDLWKFDIDGGTGGTGAWTWVAGSSQAGQFGNYSAGRGNVGGYPGGRLHAISWTGTDGNLWLFGGYGRASNNEGSLNDLWMFDTVSQTWTWVSGSNQINRSSGYYDGLAIPGGREHAASWIDRDGNLWLFGGYGASTTGWGYLNDMWMFDSDAEAWTWISGSSERNQAGNYSAGLGNAGGHPGARYKSASWTDAEGNFWMQGGEGYPDSGGDAYLNDMWKYEFYTPPTPPEPQPGSTHIVSAAYVDSHSISVTFSGPLDPANGVLDPTNYRISGPGAGTRVAPPSAPPAPPTGGMALRWTDHTPSLANPASVTHLGGNTYLLTWTGGQFAAGQPLWVHVDDEHILDLDGALLAAPHSIILMIPLAAPGCICPTP